MRWARVFAVVAAGFVLYQCTAWFLWGRSHLIERVALDDLEFSVRLAEIGAEPRGNPYDYLILNDEVVKALGPSDLEEMQAMLSSYGPTRLLTGIEWVSMTEHLGPEERWELRGKFTCWRIVPTINLPGLAEIECDDMCASVAWHGHSHWYAYVLGWWLPLGRSNDWVS